MQMVGAGPPVYEAYYFWKQPSLSTTFSRYFQRVYGTLTCCVPPGTVFLSFLDTHSVLLTQTFHYGTIGIVHPSESGTITAFQREKGESQLDEKGNVFNTFNMQDRYLFPFSSIITLIDPN